MAVNQHINLPSENFIVTCFVLNSDESKIFAGRYGGFAILDASDFNNISVNSNDLINTMAD